MTESEINVKVAELRGWTKHRNKRAACGPDIPEAERVQWEYDFVPPQFNGDPAYFRQIPRVATCANAALELVEVMAEKGFEFSSRRNSFMPREHRWKAVFCEPSREYEATAPTQSLAIAKAFITAHEGRVG